MGGNGLFDRAHRPANGRGIAVFVVGQRIDHGPYAQRGTLLLCMRGEGVAGEHLG